MKLNFQLSLFFSVLLFFIGLHPSLDAQNLKQKDREVIKEMCGCFDVEFRFAETFQYTEDSTYVPSKPKYDYGLEWVELVEDEDNLLVLQHLLIVGPPHEPMIIKHWRQDWSYEDTTLLSYVDMNRWSQEIYPSHAVRGKWTQKVFQVDDSPRYSGLGQWIHDDGKSYWESTSDAPLPRREYTKRSDYNVTKRTNRHEITLEGWIHDQDNLKVLRHAGEDDLVLAAEKGLNTYTRVPSERCRAAQLWWTKHSKKWAVVRSQWEDILVAQNELKMKATVEDKKLYEYLFDLPEDCSPEESREILDSFVEQ